MLTAFLAVLGLVTAGWVGFVLWVAYRDAHPGPPAPDVPDAALPFVSIVVAARNEERALPRCLDALLALDYPRERLEILIANDHSTDGTAEVVAAYRARDPRVHVLRVPDPVGHLRGKAHALHTAIEAAEHDLIFITDADCAPPPEWARRIAAYFADPHTGIACGHTYIADREGKHPELDRIQALDWVFLLTIAGVLVESGRPVTAMGNNMALRRQAYRAVGGYPGLPFSVTEDYELFRAICDADGWTVRFPIDPGVRNYTLPLVDFRGLYEQRKRWARGGIHAEVWVFVAYGGGHLAHLLPLVALFVAPMAGLAALGAKLAADFVMQWSALRKLGRQDLLRSFLGFEAVLFGYTLTLPVDLLVRPKIEWKERKF